MLSADDVRARAIAEGFVAARICRPDAIPDAAAHLADFVERGRHGQMGWMADRMAWRGDPAALWPEARSVVMCAESYSPAHDPLAILGTPDRGAISVYAQGRDYHDVVKKRLKRVARWMVEEGRDGQSVAPREAADAAHGGGAPGAPSRGSARSVAPVSVKVFVDTAPVMEKPLGQASGLGWQGKHTNLVGRELGSWFFLGAIFTTLDLAPDAGEVDHCGSCRKCLDICPTDAFPAPYQLDARRCISYLTIEHKGPVDPTLREGLGNRIYGCDDCLAVCPWNKFAVAARDQRLSAREALIAPPLQMLAGLDDAAFREMFSGSPIKRIGRDRFVRNVAYAIGNSEDPALRPVAQELAGDSDPVVAEAGVWAANRLKS